MQPATVCSYAAKLKPLYSSSQVKAVYSGILSELGCDCLLRRAANENRDEWGYLSSGIAAYPHRDTWYSSLVPTELVVSYLRPEPDNVMAFHPRYWSQPEERIERLQL